ncbi:hypothetical protein BV20DRAFT_954879, partial [Pilatotrama ljubarskyi]
EDEVFDETYRKAGNLEKGQFAVNFDPFAAGLLDAVRTSLLSGRPELYKLNVYGKNTFFKAHKDTPDSESMLSSLVIVLPTSHEGAASSCGTRARSGLSDSSKIFSDLGTDATNHIAWIAFFGDVEHEVTPVVSGHRLTITYNLYFGEPLSGYCLPKELSILQPARVRHPDIVSSLCALLDDSTFLPEIGKIGFGLRYQYSLLWRDRKGRPKLDKLREWLKGSDAALFEALEYLSLVQKITARQHGRHAALREDTRESARRHKLRAKLRGTSPLSPRL